MIDEVPVRITDESAFVAARFAIVPVLTFFPPVRELTMLVLSDLATEEDALVAALWNVLETADSVFFDFFLASFSRRASS